MDKRDQALIQCYLLLKQMAEATEDQWEKLVSAAINSSEVDRAHFISVLNFAAYNRKESCRDPDSWEMDKFPLYERIQGYIFDKYPDSL